MSSVADRRRPWLLVAPAVAMLGVLLILPIVIMFAYTFFEFVTAGVDKPAFSLGNWHEFFTDSYYHTFLWKTARVAIAPRDCVLLDENGRRIAP